MAGCEDEKAEVMVKLNVLYIVMWSRSGWNCISIGDVQW